ncbi:MAG: PilN domain-containing protein [Chromatiales bacterium]|jgi:general secretion pathway protein L
MESPVAGELVTSAQHRLERFLAWWRAGLVAGMPAALRTLLVPTVRTLVMRTDAAGARVELADEAGTERLAAFSQDDPFPPAVARILRQPKTSLEMVVAADRVLRRTIRWPLNVEPRLRNAIAYQLDRLTPLSAETAYFDHRVLSRDAAEGELEVEIAVVARDELDPWLERLREAGALGALRAVRAAGDEHFDFLPAEVRDASRKGTHWRWPAYGIAFAVLVAAALILPIYGKHQRLALLEREIADARASALAVTEMRQQTERLMEAITAVVQTRRRAVPVLAELEELTRLIPDSAYVQRLDYDGDSLTIAGEADKSVELVETIEASRLFDQVEFSAPVSMNPITGKERFQLQIGLAEAAP